MHSKLCKDVPLFQPNVFIIKIKMFFFTFDKFHSYQFKHNSHCLLEQFCHFEVKMRHLAHVIHAEQGSFCVWVAVQI